MGVKRGRKRKPLQVHPFYKKMASGKSVEEEGLVKAQPVVLPPEVVLPIFDDLKFARNGIYAIGVLLGFDAQEIRKKDVMQSLVANTREAFLKRQIIILCIQAARDYSTERKNDTRILTSWRKYSTNKMDKPLKAPDEVYELSSVKVVITACSLGIFPYVIDTQTGGLLAIRAMIRGALESILEPTAIRVAKYNSDSGDEMKKFYDMKKHQTLNDLRIIDPSLPEGTCPLLSKYKFGEYLGGGVYGVVLKVTAGSSSSKLGVDDYALKIQSIEDENDSVSTAYQELKVADLVMQALPRVNLGARLANIVKMYDWVKCHLDLKAKLSTLPGNYDKVFTYNGEKRKKFRGERTFQFMISEFVDGTCEKIFGDEPRTYFTSEFMRCFLTQILCSLSHLQDRYKFVHFDLHLANVLFQDIPASGTSDYLHYEIRGKHMYVPLDAAKRKIFKISDFGMAYAQYYADDEPTPRVVAGAAWYETAEGKGSKFNPRFDIHEIGCDTMARIFKVVSTGVLDPSTIDPELIATLMFMIHSRWKDSRTNDMYKRVVKAVYILELSKNEKDPVKFATTSPVREFLTDTVQTARTLKYQLFEVDEEPSSWIVTVLGYKFFKPCYIVPERSAHLIDMDLLGKKETKDVSS